MLLGCSTYSLIQGLNLPEDDYQQIVKILEKEMKYDLVSAQIVDDHQIKVISSTGQQINGREQLLFISKNSGSWAVDDEFIKIYDP